MSARRKFARGSSKLSTAYGTVRKNGKEKRNSNFSLHADFKTGILNQTVAEGQHRVFFNDLGACLHITPCFVRSDRTKRYEADMPWTATGNGVGAWSPARTYLEVARTSEVYDYEHQRRLISGSWVEADAAMAWGSMVVAHCGFGSSSVFTMTAPFWPDYYYPKTLLSSVDIPGTEIGPVYKHQIGSVSLFNNPAEAPSSQGDLIASGVYNPDEGYEGHWSLQVYITSSGGTGASTGTSGSTGSVLTADPDRFTVTGSPFTVGDEGKYIKITSGPNRGIYKIPTGGFVDANNVDTDAVTINQGFTDESNIDWELVTGPIAEYFVRRRPYSHSTAWYNEINANGSSYLPLNYMGMKMGDSTELWSMTRVVYDRGGSWWWINRDDGDDSTEKLGLMRWCHLSHSGYDTPYLNGDIGGSFPTDILGFSDICIDDANKLWIGCMNATSSTGRLFRVDPYPGSPPDASAPTMLDSVAKQTSASDATGLPSSKVQGLVCDDSQAIAAGSRIWVFCGDDGGTGDAGGIAYTDNYGTTWKRLHVLHTVTSTDTFDASGTSITRVSGSTDLTTVFAVGDWVRVGAETKSYEITNVTSTVLTTATTVTTLSGQTIQKGALAASEAVILRVGVFSQANDDQDHPHAPPCDYDSSGRVYWIPASRDKVCKWDENTGSVTTATTTDIGQTVAISDINTLKVTKIPDVADSGSSLFHDNIWISGNDLAQGGWARIQNANFDYVNDSAGITAIADAGGGQVTVTSAGHGLQNGCEIQITGTTNYNGFYVISNVTTDTFDITATWVSSQTGTWTVIITRYHWSTTTNFPKSYDLPFTGNNSTENYGIAQEPKTGCIHLHHPAANATVFNDLVLDLWDGNTAYNVNPTIYHSAGSYYNSTWTRSTLSQMQFDDFGLGIMPHYPAVRGDVSDTVGNNNRYFGAVCLFSPFWVCHRWNGTAWVMGPLNGLYSDIDFDGTPVVDKVPTPGNGVRRVHDWEEEFWGEVFLNFAQNGGATPQTSEYVADESFTLTLYLGTGKDNLAQASATMDASITPTVYRLGEAVKDIENLWTSNGGIDGGYVSGGADTDAMTAFRRGVAETHGLRTTTNAPYDLGANTWDYHTPDPISMLAALRIDDEFEKTIGEIAPPSGTPDLSVFKSTDFTFDSGDVGKSIFIEDSGKFATGSITAVVRGSLVDGDNFTIDDGENTPTVFYFDVTGTYTPPGGVEIDISGTSGADASEEAALIRSAVNGVGAGLKIDALPGTTAVVNFRSEVRSTVPNNAITESVTTTLNPTGLSGGLTDANNGQYVIQSITDANTVEVVPDFSRYQISSTNSFRWKLRNVPKVAYAAILWWEAFYFHDTNFVAGINMKLLSSSEYGGSWSLVKDMKNINAHSINQSLQQDNCFMNISEYGQSNYTWTDGANVQNNATIFFRLSDVAGYSEGSTRRQYWKFFKDQIAWLSARNFIFQSVILYDENFNILGRTVNNRTFDANDSLFSSSYESKPCFVPYESTTVGQPSGGGTYTTDTVSAGSESFYEASQTTGETTVGGTNFKDTTYGKFTYQDVGKYIRINEGGAITAIADLGGSPNEVRVSAATHGRAVGDEIVISGTIDYDGTYTITNINDANTFDIESAAGSPVSQTGTWASSVNGFHVITAFVNSDEVVTGTSGLDPQTGLDWQLLTFGAGDFVRFKSSSLIPSAEGAALEDTYYEIADVPSNTTIQLTESILPKTIGGSPWTANFDINRDIPYASLVSAGWDSGGKFYGRNRFGTLYYSTDIEFIEIDTNTGSPAVTVFESYDTYKTGDDYDGDGRVDSVTINAVLPGEDGTFSAVANNGSGKARFTTSAVHGMAVGEYVIISGGAIYNGRYIITAVPDTTHFDVDVAYSATDSGNFSSYTGPGDYILLIGSTNYGRRVIEIQSITRGGSTTELVLKFDELLPNDTFTEWYVYQRRDWMKAAMRRTVAWFNETP